MIYTFTEDKLKNEILTNMKFSKMWLNNDTVLCNEYYGRMIAYREIYEQLTGKEIADELKQIADYDMEYNEKFWQ